MNLEKRNAIVSIWAARAKAQGLDPRTQRYLTAQGHFVAGALAALDENDPTLVLYVMTGQDVVKLLDRKNG